MKVATNTKTLITLAASGLKTRVENNLQQKIPFRYLE
jgi:hypothetical protein